MRSSVSNVVFGAAIFLRRMFHPGRATLLNYHRFPASSASSFRRQCEYLKANCHVIGMSDLIARLNDGTSPPHPVVITVDDGHRDFYTCAYPILREFGFPAVMYLPTAFMDGAWLWFDRLQYIFQQTPLERADLAGMPPLPEVSLDLKSPAAREEAFQNVARPAQWLPAAERDRLGERLEVLLRVDVPERPPESFAPLTWDDVREMARHGVEFGGHTVNHPILRTLHTPESLETEIAGCKSRVERELGDPVAHFAYPSGRANEVAPLAREAVRNAGFATGVCTENGQVSPGDDLYWLRRVGADPRDDLPFFRRCVASVRGE